MIWTIVRIGFLNLRNGGPEILLLLTVPLVFFSIFALIFDQGIGGGATTRIRVVLVDEDGSPPSRHLISSIGKDETLRVFQGEPGWEGEDAVPLVEFSTAEQAVQRGLVKAAVYIPAGWGASQENGKDEVPIQVLTDSFDPIAKQIVLSLVQGHSLQSAAKRQNRPPAGSPSGPPAETPAPTSSHSSTRLSAPAVEEVDVLGAAKANPVLSAYAAGIVVVFVLFSSTGFAGTLLDERESQTLERLLNGKVRMHQLLAGKWIFIFLIGFLQVLCMFLWALLYGVNFLGNLFPFLLMTVATVAAASSFALVMATACQTRGQLGSVSTVIILIMSALGGSMVPRYVMSESVQELGRATFNAWAVDGFNKVFWYQDSLAALLPELSVLTGAAVLGFLAARLLAFRWEQIA